jgi:ABC-type transport system involved in cytochrome c biogenesis permease subunit
MKSLANPPTLNLNKDRRVDSIEGCVMSIGKILSGLNKLANKRFINILAAGFVLFALIDTLNDPTRASNYASVFALLIVLVLLVTLFVKMK